MRPSMTRGPPICHPSAYHYAHVFLARYALCSCMYGALRLSLVLHVDMVSLAGDMHYPST